MSILPAVNTYGLYEVRFESIGGLGANLAGKMLSEIGQDLGLNVASFSSYGSEKKGSPVKAFIRFADSQTEIKITTPIEHPHMLVIFSDAILKNPGVLSGVNENTIIIVNTSKSEQEIVKLMALPGANLWLVDATNIALEEEVKINGVLLGALSKATDFISKDVVIKIFESILGRKYPALLQANIKAIERGHSEVVHYSVIGDTTATFPESARVGGIGYECQPIGGVIPNAGNAGLRNNAAGRYGWIPLFNTEKCINCGMCNIMCPDQSIVFLPGKDKKTGKDTMNMAGIDYQFCKGCLKCVEICPVKALTEVKEAEYDVNALTVEAFDKSKTVQNVYRGK